ncbi:MAG: hypothetical protein ACKO44_05195 [Algoriphagus sp.]
MVSCPINLNILLTRYGPTGYSRSCSQSTIDRTPSVGWLVKCVSINDIIFRFSGFSGIGA